MKRGNRMLDPVPVVLLALLCLLTAGAAFVSVPLLIAGAALTTVGAVVTAVGIVVRGKNLRRFYAGLARELSEESQVLSSLPMPVLVTQDGGRILWYNDAMRNRLLAGQDCLGGSAELLVPPEAAEQLAQTGGAEVTYKDRVYQVYVAYGVAGGERCAVYYFIDQTRLRNTAAEYQQSRPAVAFVAVDNLDELYRDAKDSEKAAISGAIESEIENWAAQADGVFRKLSNDRFLLVTEERSLKRLTDNRFDVLDKVRALRFGERGNATLSIGVGRGGNLSECEDMARQALDMALGRGGDQAAVKTRNDFEFFGGVTSTVQKRTRVRTRVVASALRELIESSDNVLVMGHRFADLDCFGAAFGMLQTVRQLGKPAHIVMTREKALCGQLLAQVERRESPDTVLSPEEARGLMTRKTLLIVVDTHRPSFLDDPAVYEAAQTVVVIDHHRKTVDYIDKAVIFYHEPYASSASEMVAELLPYIGAGRVGKLEAEALLAGITLDTRNFVLHTGVRTFEASAYLRSCGADPVAVKRMFAGSMELYKERAAIVASATIYDDCAISETQSADTDVRIAASQAADEMLTIEKVNGAFVLFQADGEINISARSLGAMNVQVIMESLGGGGHLTMAAAQLPGQDFETARQNLIAAIDSYKHNTVK